MRVVVITGASSGFGKGIALELARRGATVVLAARRGEVLDELARECEASGGRALAVPTDVGVREEVQALAETAIGQLGGIDVWINNAGVGAIGRFERIPLADHVKVVETTLLGTLYGSWFAYRHFAARERGVLINIASELGRHTVPYYTSYAAAKHGVVGMTDSLRQEALTAKLEDVHMCTVLPTAHDTPFFDHVANYTGHQVQAPEPLHDPQDVVDAVLKLIDDHKSNEIVGGDGVVKIMLKNLAPKLAEKMGAKQMHKTQFEKAPPAADSAGAVRAPMKAGTAVRAGRRASGKPAA